MPQQVLYVFYIGAFDLPVQHSCDRVVSVEQCAFLKLKTIPQKKPCSLQGFQ